MQSESKTTLQTSNNHKRNCSQRAYKSLKKFSQETTFHGIKYLSEEHRTTAEKVWWTCGVLLCIGLCALFIWWIVLNWIQTPVVMVLDDSPTPIYKIPFPSITICSQGKYMQHELDFGVAKRTILGEDDFSGVEPEPLSNETMANFEAIAPLCNVDEYYFLKNNYDTSEQFEGKIHMNPDVVKRMIKLNNDVKSLMLSALDYTEASNEYFIPTLTEHGLCETFNIVSDMFNENVIQNEYDYFMNKINISGWSFEAGYTDGSNFTYPIRKLFAGKSKSLMMVLRSDKSFIDSSCFQEPGFKVMVHSPTEYPSHHKYLLAPYNSFVEIKVEPKLTKTADSLKFYSPQRRQCYFPEEHKLKFFKIYNEHNCKLECLSKIMLERCGCVTFPLPRENGIRICEVHETECYDGILNNAGNEEVQQKFDEEYFGKKSNPSKVKECDCLPPCTSVEYKVELTSNDDIRNVGSKSSRLQSEVVIYYEYPTFMGTTRKELYGFSDLISNFGGLIGLFLGGSVLSILELIFFCLCCTSRKQKVDETDDGKIETTAF